LKAKLVALVCLGSVLVGCGGGVSSSNMLQENASARSSSAKRAGHVFLVIEENRSFSTVYHNQMPWLSELGDKYGIATNYFSNEQGSLLDYLWLSSGSGERNFGCDGNQCKQTIDDANIFRELNAAGMSWKMYADSLPKTGYLGAHSGEYVKRHNPAVWYTDVVNHPEQQQNVVAFTEFAKDLANDSLPDYSIIVPNLKHDAHDGSPAAADAWLKENIGPLVNSRLFQPGSNSVMFITFDNGDGDAQGQVLTAVVGDNVVRGVKVDTPFRHENTLRTIMELLGLKNFPGASATAAPMNEFFN